jgi:CRP-like cAMP-binding protein
VPESRPSSGAAGTPSPGLDWLCAEVRPHEIEPGAVGDYVALQIRAGADEARRAFPDVATHGVDDCLSCAEIARDVRGLLGTAALLTAAPAVVPPPDAAQVHGLPAQMTQTDLTAALVPATAAGDHTIRGVEVLRKVPLFAGLPPAELERLGSLVRARRYRRGEVIFLEGDVGASLCVIASGQVRIVLSGADGREVVLNVYGPGEFFGEFALLDGKPRSADAIAQETCLLYQLVREDFLSFLESHPRAASTLLAVLSRRVRHTTRVVQDATFRDVPARLARVVLDLATTRGRTTKDGVVLDGRFTQTDLAAMVGASRETVNKALRAFERDGLLRHARGTIMVMRPERLRERADAG